MKITKTKVKAMSRILNAKYTMENPQETLVDCSAEYANILQEMIDREIINEVKAQQLVNEGWTKVPFIVKITIDWFKENMQDEYLRLGDAMYFKSSEDAVLYSLTWSDKGIYYD
jgi:hemerythrin-like domain-containing protein